MPLPPDDASPTPPMPAPLRSPRAAVARSLVYRRRGGDRGHSRWLRIVALALSLLVHLAFVIGVLLGPAYVPPPPLVDDSPLRVRLIDLAPAPPPPPPMRGTEPKQRGPLKSSRRAAARSTRKPAIAREKSATTTASTAIRARSPARQPAVAAAPKPPTKAAAPQPDLQPVPLAPPSITFDSPPITQPVPPPFQPQPMRRPTPEGNQPVVPPPSLANPTQPMQAPIRISLPSMAVDTAVPDIQRPASAPLARAQMAAASPAPALPPEPRAVPPAAITLPLELQPPIEAPAAPVIDQRPERQAITVQSPEPPAEAPLPSVPIAPTALDDLPRPTPLAEAPTVAPVDARIAPPQLGEIEASADATAQPADATAAPASPSEAGGQTAASAPNATAQGSDTAMPGSPSGVAPLSPASGEGRAATLKPGQGVVPSGTGTSGQRGDRAQADSGGKPGTFIQIKPHGDTDIMRHAAPNIGYKPTRFEQDWAPENETILDSALRKAVEKTTVEHTFHLPRGVRIKCVVMPLFPMLMLGCGNPDPPAKVLDQAIYNRLNLAPAKPLVPPLPDATASAAPPVRLDNSVECANARVAGGPPPPGCEAIQPASSPGVSPAPTGSSWAPPSDRFQ